VSSASEPPLQGLRVLDAGDFLAAPYCAMLLGDFGADVIKVESLHGDTLRSIGEQVAPPRVSAMFVAANRGKRSISLDLGGERGRSLLRELALACDVVIHNRPAEAAEAVGIAYGQLAETRADIVVGSVTAFGDVGPYSGRGGVDPIAQAMSGMAAVTGAVGGPPMRSGVTVVDFGAGMMLAYGVMTALWRRERSGVGQWVSTSLLDVALTYSSSLYPLADALRGQPPPRLENRSHAMVADQFATTDGFVVLAVWDEKRWQSLCRLLGLSELAEDPSLTSNQARLENYQRVRPALQRAIEGWSSPELVRRLAELKIPATQTYDTTQVLADEHIQAVESIYEERRLGPLFHMVSGALRSGGDRRMHGSPPPRVGQHTDEILKQVLGLGESDCDALARAGVVHPGSTDQLVGGSARM
jgi:crotonobetainyl-CoA:carnitine CoA-transferase CaiB-like acyl-CoA transferase